ncbi:mitochondrial ribosomal protein L34 [Carabus blaptoides fortunei]
MASLTRFIPTLLNTIQQLPSIILSNSFHNVSSTVTNSTSLVPGGTFTLAVRNKIRCYFPRPSERKRIKRHGWLHRMSTLEGRRTIMRRILKGRHVLSH